jgi:hypothetical protein
MDLIGIVDLMGIAALSLSEGRGMLFKVGEVSNFFRKKIEIF